LVSIRAGPTNNRIKKDDLAVVCLVARVRTTDFFLEGAMDGVEQFARATSKRLSNRDRAIGKRVRAMRIEQRMSQTTLGDEIGVTFQQIQKYENGVNRISVGRLQKIAEALRVPVSIFFDIVSALGDVPSPVDDLQTEGAVRLLRAYSRVTDLRARHALINIAKYLAEQTGSRSMAARTRAFLTASDDHGQKRS
jgi:transcriptional regulator with XRE-family HTH domain